MLVAAVAMACRGGEAVRPVPVLRVGFEGLENLRAPDGTESFKGALTLTNAGEVPLDQGWTLYFDFQRTVLPESLPAGVEIVRLAGDFQRLSPTPSFAPLAPGESRRIELAGLWALNKLTDAPMGAYLVMGEDGAPLPVPVTVLGVAPPAGGQPAGRPSDQPLLPTPASRFRENARVSALPVGEVLPLVPTPVRFERGSGSVVLDDVWTIAHEPGLEREALHLAETLEELLGARPEVVADGAAREGRFLRVSLALGSPEVGGVATAAGDEAYRLEVGTEVDAGMILIVGSDPAGVFYGVQTLLALLPVEAWASAPLRSLGVPIVGVEDRPRFPYRGLHLDVARNFHPPETVEKLLRLMAFYKLNRFHLHLSDDEGWRLEIAGLPELTAVGGRRGHTTDELDRLVPSFGSGPFPDPDLSHGSGFYTREELVRILRLAERLHIRVIPEIDGPGHARAAIRSMESRRRRLAAEGREEEATAFLLTDPEDTSVHRSVQGWEDNVINPCLESSYRFLETVVDDLRSIWDEAGAALIGVHIGGDEVPRGVWEGSPVCQRFLAEHPEISGAPALFGHYVDRVSALLHERGLVTAGWEEIALEHVEGGAGGAGKAPNPALLARDLLPYVWNNVWRGGAEDLGYRLANAGYPVVLSNATNLYLDLAYDRDPAEPGFTWAGLTDERTAYEFVPLDLFKSAREDLLGRPIDPDTEFAERVRPTAAGSENVLGIQGQLWGENALGRDSLEYMAFPKVLGLAERAWAPDPAWAAIARRVERDRALDVAWNEFANRLGTRELPRLDHLLGGVAYRLPPPGAVVEGGVLSANLPYPGIEIRYTTDGTPPTPASTLYRGPVPVQGDAPGPTPDDVRLRAFDTRGRGGRETRLPAGGAR